MKHSIIIRLYKTNRLKRKKYRCNLDELGGSTTIFYFYDNSIMLFHFVTFREKEFSLSSSSMFFYLQIDEI